MVSKLHFKKFSQIYFHPKQDSLIPFMQEFPADVDGRERGRPRLRRLAARSINPFGNGRRGCHRRAPSVP